MSVAGTGNKLRKNVMNMKMYSQFPHVNKKRRFMNILIIAVGIIAVMITGFAFASRLGKTGDTPYQTAVQGSVKPGTDNAGSGTGTLS